MKNSGAIGHDPGQKYNINVIMISHLFSPGEVYTSPVSIMWLYGLYHIWKSKAASFSKAAGCCSLSTAALAALAALARSSWPV